MNKFLLDFASHQPIIFSLTAILLPTLGIKLIHASLERFKLSEMAKRLILEALSCSYVAALLTALGWWRAAGFTQSISGKALLAYAPWLLLPLLVVVSSGVRTAGKKQMLGFTIFALMIGFAEEGLMRGLVLNAMLPGGVGRAAFLSALFFGLAHLFNIFQSQDPKNVLVQVIYATLIGIGFAGPRLYTGTIWPAIVLHALIDLTDFASRGFTMPQPRPFVLKQAIVPIGITALYALYGWWLLFQ